MDSSSFATKTSPPRLLGLDLKEFCGINVRMQARLNAHGVFTSDDLLTKSARDLTRIFGSVQGDRWWYLLRGYDMTHDFREGKSLGHSNVLAPDLRTDDGARGIMLRLLHKACARMRSNNVVAEHVYLSVTGYNRSWSVETRIPASNDAIAIGERLLELWESRDFDKPSKVGVTFTSLRKPELVTPSLFDAQPERKELGKAVDAVNNKFGKNSIFLASTTKTKDHATEKIAFNKTWLFQEGKGDHDWQPEEKPIQTRNVP